MGRNGYLEKKNSKNLEDISELLKLYEILGCADESNAKIERKFSILNLIKSNLRNRLSIPIVNKILILVLNAYKPPLSYKD